MQGTNLLGNEDREKNISIEFAGCLQGHSTRKGFQTFHSVHTWFRSSQPMSLDMEFVPTISVNGVFVCQDPTRVQPFLSKVFEAMSKARV